MNFFSFETLLGIGSIIFAIAYAWERFRSGGKQADSDLIVSLTNNLKAQKEINDSMADQMAKMQAQHTDQIKGLQAQILELTRQIGELQGIKSANDQKIKEYIDIIANRNPQLEETLLKLESLIREVVPFMDDVRRWHKDLRDQLNITDHPPQRGRKAS